MAERTDSTARTLGLLVFALGVALLVAVFAESWRLMGREAGGPAPSNLALDALYLAGHVGLLFVLGYVASSITGRGVQLYLASHSVLPHEPARSLVES